VIPRPVDTATFSPDAGDDEGVAAVRNAWEIAPQMCVVLVPGPLAPRNGQMVMVEAARSLGASGERNTVYVFAGDDRIEPRYAAELRRRAQRTRSTLCAASSAIAPTCQRHLPPPTGSAAAEAQAMGRPVVVTAVGMLPENMLGPPRMPEGLRTGWLVRLGNVADLARATAAALSLNPTAYEARGARARQFVKFMFSPPRVAEAVRAVYTSLQARDA
jgi:glycosyltransferase involved in cell wall biosynthesis